MTTEATAADDPITTTSTTPTTASLLLRRRMHRHLGHFHGIRNPLYGFASTSREEDDSEHLPHWQYSQFDDRNFEIHGKTLFYILILFAILVLLTLVLLYLRWLIRLRRFRQGAPQPQQQPQSAVSSSSFSSFFSFSSSSASASAAAAATSSSSVPAQRGLDPVFIQSLPVTLHHDIVGGGGDDDGMMAMTECCICLGVFEGGDMIKDLPKCRHRYHAHCVDKWLMSNPCCPLCRSSIQAAA